MRIRIVIALLAALAVALVAAPSAFASDWAMSIRSDKAPANYGETVTITAKPTFQSQVVRGVWVRISLSTNGRDFRTVAEGQTDVDGLLTYQFNPTQKVFVRCATVYEGVSATYTQECRALLTLKAPTEQLTGAYFSVYGEIRPRHAEGTRPVRVVFEKWESGRWVVRQTLDPYNSDWEGKTVYHGGARLTSPGSWRVHAVHNDWGHALTSTKPQLIVVKDPPVPVRAIAWVNDHYPSRNSTVTVYARAYDQYGKPYLMTSAAFTWRFETWTRTATRYPWKDDGVIFDPYRIGALKPDYKVVVEVTLVRSGKPSLKATNWFVPQRPSAVIPPPATRPLPIEPALP